MAESVKCNVSLEELEQYRDEEGFINLDSLNLEFTEASREKVGREERLKNWVNFAGTQVLLKGECMVNGKRNGSIYAELIIEELAKQAGFSSAYYDLIKINGQRGVLSKKMYQGRHGDLISLYSLIGDTKIQEEYPEISDYLEVEEKLYKSLKEEGIEKSKRKQIIQDYRKQNAFFIMICAVDKHTENLSVFSYINPENKQRELELSCVYDSEEALLLDTDLETLQKILKHGLGLQKNVDMLDSKISVLKGNYTSLWKNTLDTLLEDDDVYDFVAEAYNKINIDKAIEAVEKKIKAPIPTVVRTTAKYVFQFRQKEIEKILFPEIGKSLIGKEYSEQIASRAMEEEIRQGEEDDILRKIMQIYGIEEINEER